jgi:hypothetical protein
MRRSAALLITALVSMTAAAQQTTLEALHDRSRPLLIFTSDGDPRLSQQLSELESHSPELRDREMQVVVVGTGTGETSHPTQVPLATFAATEQEHARHRFHVKAGEFVVVLVGKDGGEKLRSSSPISWQRLSSTIDSMPMRKDEIRQR